MRRKRNFHWIYRSQHNFPACIGFALNCEHQLCFDVQSTLQLESKTSHALLVWPLECPIGKPFYHTLCRTAETHDTCDMSQQQTVLGQRTDAVKISQSEVFSVTPAVNPSRYARLSREASQADKLPLEIDMTSVNSVGTGHLQK